MELVALYDNIIVGHIVYTKGYVDGVNNDTFITFGPISVSPKFQNKQIGSKLIRISLQKAARIGYSAVFITGDENYYSRFLFEYASKYNIHLEGIPEEDEAPFFMVRCLKEDALDNVSGCFVFNDYYNVNDTMYFVDLPGYGYAKVSREERAKWGVMIEKYLHTSPSLKAVFLLVDSRHEPSANDVNMYDWIVYHGFEPVIIATKADKINRSQLAKQVRLLRSHLGLPAETKLIPFSAETKQGREEIWETITAVTDTVSVS